MKKLQLECKLKCKPFEDLNKFVKIDPRKSPDRFCRFSIRFIQNMLWQCTWIIDWPIQIAICNNAIIKF